ncbi:MAG: DNA mismatch repair endonuclease MutL [Spirochaetota bacterium]
MGHIITLPEDVSGKIAAGEVIDGPYSVVRELLDNSLDAGGKNITVTVNNGGKDYIKVIDDGEGMSEEDAALSIKKHTTSKIKDLSDLDVLSTMGFRGEALSSICMVSNFSMLTRRRPDQHGTRLKCFYGKEMSIEPSAAKIGTEVVVKNLFYNLPARKKFLKSNRAESSRIKEEVVKKALGFCGRGVSLTADDREVYTLAPTDSLPQRIEDIFGRPMKQNLLEISHEEEDFSLYGYLTNKNATLSNRSGQYIFVNGRPVLDKSFQYVTNEPSRGVLPAGRFVYAFVFIDINPSLVDINVHPAKREVKIKIHQKICSALHRVVLQTLRQDFYSGVGIPGDKDAASCQGISPGYPGHATDYSEKSLWEKAEGSREDELSSRIREPSSGAFHPGSNFSSDIQEDVIPEGTKEGTENAALRKTFFQSRLVEADFPRPEEIIPVKAGKVGFKGSLFSTYLVFEGEGFLILIDQHAAHERVLYEKLSREAAAGDYSKNLLVPLNFTPPRKYYDDISNNLKVFDKAGIKIEPFGEESFNVLTVPSFIPEKDEQEAIHLLLDEFYSGNVNLDPQIIRQKFLKVAACRAAVKEGERLDEQKAVALLESMFRSEIPYVCPHGRPTVLKMSRSYFDKLFQRK